MRNRLPTEFHKIANKEKTHRDTKRTWHTTAEIPTNHAIVNKIKYKRANS